MIAQILIHTPSLVYGLFVVLVAFGLKQTRNRNVNAVLAYVLPFAMVALSFAGIKSSFGIKAAPITMWALGLLMVTLIGFKYFRDDRIRFVQSSGSFFIPGSWTPFLVIMAIFFTKYVFAVMRASNAEMVSTSTFVATLSLAYGCFSGYFCSRVLNLVTKSKDTQTLTGRST
jgi:hypothetical protein